MLMSLNYLQVLHGYAQGIFPMAHEGTILWFDPDPRAVLPLGTFHTPRRLARTVRQGKYEVTRDRAFAAVIARCAAPGPDRDDTWIDGDIIETYSMLHGLGFAHSVEAWQCGELVGGLYGVALGGLFAGESMFSESRDASKVALVHLVRHLDSRGFVLLDVQFMTDHLRQFGAIRISRQRYRKLLGEALAVPAHF